MPDTLRLEKARLQEMEAGKDKPKAGGMDIEVQFNPDTLKLSYSIQSSAGATDNKSNTTPKQVISGGSVKLTMQLWFDVSALADGVKKVSDVRELTKEVIYFVVPRKGDQQESMVVPEMQITWGSFLFRGVVDSLEELLEFFSHEGKPLRASISLSMSSQKLLDPTPQQANSGPGSTSPGTIPLEQASAGLSLQRLAASAGLGGNWQAIAAANGIDNPRLLQPGQLLNLQAGISGSAKIG